MHGKARDSKLLAIAAGRLESCEGKKRFTNWDAAAFAAKHVRRNRKIAVTTYPCRKCCGFHIGEKLK